MQTHQHHLQKEQWKTVAMDLGFEINLKLEVSNLGRVRTTKKNEDKDTQVNYPACGTTEGYKIYRCSFYKPRSADLQQKFDCKLKHSNKLHLQLIHLKKQNRSQTFIKEKENLLQKIRTKLSKEIAKERKTRAVYFGKLIHKLVAEYFLPTPKQGQIIVAHLDHDKLNNQATNLKWMTRAEHNEHQQNSPYVQAALAQRKTKHYTKQPKHFKLTTTKVMLIKKMLNNGKTLKSLAKQFKVTDVQISRIRRGENWADVPAAV